MIRRPRAAKMIGDYATKRLNEATDAHSKAEMEY